MIISLCEMMVPDVSVFGPQHVLFLYLQGILVMSSEERSVEGSPNRSSAAEGKRDKETPLGL